LGFSSCICICFTSNFKACIGWYIPFTCFERWIYNTRLFFSVLRTIWF